MFEITDAEKLRDAYTLLAFIRDDVPTTTAGQKSSLAAKGKFFTQEGGLYIGVDNSDGNAWTEEFSDRQQLFLWFADQPCRNAHGTPLNQ